MDRFDRILRLELGYLRLANRFAACLDDARQQGDAADIDFWEKELSRIFLRREQALAKLEGE